MRGIDRTSQPGLGESSSKLPDLHSLPAGSRPEHAIRNNGPASLALERFKLRELAEGWPMYRFVNTLPIALIFIISIDPILSSKSANPFSSFLPTSDKRSLNLILSSDACEWENLLSLFHPDAYIYTTWTGRTHHLDFIAASKAGMDKGAFIMHRCHGASTDINQGATRAVTKMKATITQRFVVDGCEVDAESDCRFCFFWERWSVEDGGDGEQWRARLVRHWYEKDKLITVDPSRVPKLDKERLKGYPTGYRYLAYCQEETMGVKVKLDLPGHRREPDNVNGQKHDLLYWQCKRWVEGATVEATFTE